MKALEGTGGIPSSSSIPVTPLRSIGLQQSNANVLSSELVL
jgi:hypothetical protein